MNAHHNAVLAHSNDAYFKALEEDSSRSKSKSDPAAHQEFSVLLHSLREVSAIMQSDALSSISKRNIRRTVVAISIMLGDVRTMIAGEPAAGIDEIPRGYVSSMEYELIAMDYRDTDTPAATLFGEMDNIHQRLMEKFNHMTQQSA